MQIIGAKNSECGYDNQNNSMATARSVSNLNFPTLVYLGI